MKTIIIAIIAATTLGAFAPQAEAANYSSRSSYCAPRLVQTCEVNRCRVRKMAYDECGRCYTYYVTTVTYRSHYSDGSSRTYSKTYRA